MGHRFPRGDADPRLKTSAYRKARAELKRRAQLANAPCSRCRGPISYDAPYWVTVMGRKTVNPRAFVAGHIIARADGGTDDLSNLRPECARCSIISGAKDGAKRQRRAGRGRGRSIPRPATASRWVRTTPRAS